MRDRQIIFAIGVFVLGTIIAPAAHILALGHDHHDSCCHGGGHEDPEPTRHDSEHCAVCQLTQAPIAAVVPVIAPILCAAVVALQPPAHTEPPAFRAKFALPFSCGPPV